MVDSLGKFIKEHYEITKDKKHIVLYKDFYDLYWDIVCEQGNPLGRNVLARELRKVWCIGMGTGRTTGNKLHVWGIKLKTKKQLLKEIPQPFTDYLSDTITITGDYTDSVMAQEITGEGKDSTYFQYTHHLVTWAKASGVFIQTSTDGELRLFGVVFAPDNAL